MKNKNIKEILKVTKIQCFDCGEIAELELLNSDLKYCYECAKQKAIDDCIDKGVFTYLEDEAEEENN
jgi:hypothetical protein